MGNWHGQSIFETVLVAFIVGFILHALRRGFQLFRNRESKKSLLVEAVMTGELQKIKESFFADPKAINLPGGNGYFPLHAAILAKAPIDVIEFLLENGADTGARTRKGSNAMDLAKSKEWPEAISLLSKHDHN